MTQSRIAPKNLLLMLTLLLHIVQFQVTVTNGQQLVTQIFNRLVPNSVTTTSSYHYRQRKVLDESRNFTIEWEANRNTNLIVFNVTAQVTNGYLALGLSLRGQVEGADLAILSGIGSGQRTLTDMYGVNNGTIARDEQQDWRLLRAETRDGMTSFTMSRSFDTCDNEDILINSDLRHIIWRIGNNEEVPMEFTAEGDVRVYLIDPFVRPSTQPLRNWRLSRRYRLPPRQTSYWCTIHKGLSFNRKQHIVGFQAYLPTEEARRHIHHQVLYRCITPPLIDPAAIFERYVGHPGEECYLEQRHQLPTLFCTEIVHSFGVGGEPFKLPDNIGIVLGETRNEYFMFEVHYDNPELRSDIEIESGVDFQYTPVLRPLEGSIMILGTGLLGLSFIPPQASNFLLAGQCSPECTKTIVPPTGVNIVGTMLHAHMTTHSVRLKHYRVNEERPWIQSDDNYDYSFQQIRLVPNPRLVLPNDRISVECLMDTNKRNRTTMSGFSTTDEMCVTFVVVDKRLPFLYCSSEYPIERALAKYGIQNVTWDREEQHRVINEASNPNFIGRPLGEVVDTYFPWTPERREQLIREQLYGEHYATCPPTRRLAMLAYLALFVDNFFDGLLNLSEPLEDQRPTTRTVTTPGSSNASMTRYPTGVMIYTPPPRVCRLRRINLP